MVQLNQLSSNFLLYRVIIYMIPSGIDPNSSYFKFLLSEEQEILKNKWILSEKLGRDCGMEYAVWDWSMRCRHLWISGLKRDGKYPLY